MKTPTSRSRRDHSSELNQGLPLLLKPRELDAINERGRQRTGSRRVQETGAATQRRTSASDSCETPEVIGQRAKQPGQRVVQFPRSVANWDQMLLTRMTPCCADKVDPSANGCRQRVDLLVAPG